MSNRKSTDDALGISQILGNEASRSLSRAYSRGEGSTINEKLLSAVANAENGGQVDYHDASYPHGTAPNMWSKDYIGLYSQYAAVGLLYGTSGTFYPFCSYVYHGDGNLCANAKNIVFFAWGLKLFFAVLTDTVRPFGLRRKPWMLFGWGGVLAIYAFLAIFANKLEAGSWLGTQLAAQTFMMFANVPADGYSVELGHLEPPEQRGQILATGQRMRFTFCIVAGVIQTFLTNGPTTSSDDCDISFGECWAWGLNINGFYALITAMIMVLYIPIWFLKEPDASNYPHHTVSGLFAELWVTMQNLTTFNLIIFVIGVGLCTAVTSAANIILQYYVINLTNFQSGIDTITTYMGLVLAIYLFQTFLINKNWRHTEYASIFISSLLGLIWIPSYYNLGGTRNAWYTIFVDLDTTFSQGIVQVLFSMCVIELAKKGQEATTFELVITIANTSSTLAAIMAVQLLSAFNAASCNADDDHGCPSSTVDVSSVDAFVASNGPFRFTMYCLTLAGLGILGGLIFTPFLPISKAQCQEWKEKGEEAGEKNGRIRGWITLILASVFVIYGLTVSVLLLIPSTSCLPAVGGDGC